VTVLNAERMMTCTCRMAGVFLSDESFPFGGA